MEELIIFLFSIVLLNLLYLMIVERKLTLVLNKLSAKEEASCPLNKTTSVKVEQTESTDSNKEEAETPAIHTEDVVTEKDEQKNPS